MTTGGEILFLAHRVPFPPDRGDKIRSHHVLRALAALAPVHVATFGDDERDMNCEKDLARVAASHCLVLRDKPLWRAGAEALLSGKAVSLTAFDDARITEFIARTIASRPIRTIYVFSGQMGQYLPAGYTGRVIADLVDVDSAKFEQYAFAGQGPRRWIDTREARLLRQEEERLSAAATDTVLVSRSEAELFRSRLSDAAGHTISALGNGIDTGYFDPLLGAAAPELASTPGPHLVFTGQMDYAPNIEAAERLIHGILPRIRKFHPDATCHVVGRNPPAALRRMDRRSGTRVWGSVPDVRPFLAAADIVAAPLKLARGVQNKVLEAMAMARPVVVTPQAATGIDAIDGVHMAVAEDDAALADKALALLADKAAAARMGKAARGFVLECRSWDAMLANLPAMAGFPGTTSEQRNVA